MFDAKILFNILNFINLFYLLLLMSIYNKIYEY